MFNIKKESVFMSFKRRVLSTFLMLAMLISFIPFNYSLKSVAREKEDSIRVDGDITDWQIVPDKMSYDEKIKLWRVCKDQSNMYLMAITHNEGGHNAFFTKEIKLSNNRVITVSKDGRVKDNTGKIVEGANFKVANFNYDWYFTNELSIPLSYIGEDTSISFAGTSLSKYQVNSLANIRKHLEEGQKTGDSDDASIEKNEYNGITIDGSFSDWNVKEIKTYTVEGDNKNIKKVAAVWEKDTVYVYLKENETLNDGNIVDATIGKNGTFVLQTDKNVKTTFTIKMNNKTPSVLVDGSKKSIASIRYNNHAYEIAIKLSELNGNKDIKHLNLGIYNKDGSDIALITNITNIIKDGTMNNPDYDGNDISYDGSFLEWYNYPKQLIKKNGKVVAEGAIFYNPNGVNPEINNEKGPIIIGHIKMKTADFNTDWLNPFIISYNNNYKTEKLYGRYRNVTRQVWNLSRTRNNYKTLKKLAKRDNIPKQFDFVLVNEAGKNRLMQDMQRKNDKYIKGHLRGTIYPNGTMECEFIMPASKDVKAQTVTIKFPKLGDNGITDGGASTGAILGILLSMFTVGGTLLYRRKKYGVLFPGM